MASETVLENQSQQQQQRPARFEFIFTVNGNIICQRYLWIENFKPRALSSTQFLETFNSCVKMIKEDLVSKSSRFLQYTSPQIFDTLEDLNAWVENPTFAIDDMSYIILRDREGVYLWNDGKLQPSNVYIDRASYIGGLGNENPCVLRFAFVDGGKEVIAREWDGTVYPRFVRSNIDLTNTKNKYDYGANFDPFCSALMKILIAGREDLIPKIIEKFTKVCSFEDNTMYKTVDSYGPRSYNFRTFASWRNKVKDMEAKYAKKTEAYFNYGITGDPEKFFDEVERKAAKKKH